MNHGDRRWVDEATRDVCDHLARLTYDTVGMPREQLFLLQTEIFSRCFRELENFCLFTDDVQRKMLSERRELCADINKNVSIPGIVPHRGVWASKTNEK